MSDRQYKITPSRPIKKCDVDYSDIHISLKVVYDTREPIHLYLHRQCYVGKMTTLDVSQKCDSELYKRIKTCLGQWQEIGERVTHLRVVIFCSPTVTERGLENIVRDSRLQLCNAVPGNDTKHALNHLYILSFLFESSPERDILLDRTLPDTLRTRHPNMCFSAMFFHFLEDFRYADIRITAREERFDKDAGIRRLCEIPREQDMRLVIRRREVTILLEQFEKDGDRKAFVDALVNLH